MTPAQVQAFNEGIRTVLRIADTVANAIKRADGYKPTRLFIRVRLLVGSRSLRYRVG